MLRFRIAAAGALAALAIACHRGPPPAIDPAAAACLPPDATILAGVNLARLRASPLANQLPPVAQAFLSPLGEADSLLLASDGSRYLALVRGSFRQAPAGATLLRPGLAAEGSADWLRAAMSGRRSGAAGGSALLSTAEPLAAAAEIWIAAAGHARLPLSGNGENLNRLLQATDVATLSVRLTDRMALEAVGRCRGAEAAQHLEETVRAWIAMGAAGTRREPALSGLLRRVQVAREDRVVRITLLASAAEINALWGAF